MIVLTNNTHCYCRFQRLHVFHRQRDCFVMNQEREEDMLQAREYNSEVSQLLAQISAEYEAAQRGLSGIAYGTSQHAFITARMENMGQIHTRLQQLVGDDAIAMIAEELNNCQ